MSLWEDQLLALLSFSQIVPVAHKFKAPGLFEGGGYLKPIRGEEKRRGASKRHLLCVVTPLSLSTMVLSLYRLLKLGGGIQDDCCLQETSDARK